jgi:cytidyltransferase-like protein
MRRIYATMVADLFHYGHVEFLRAARELGDYLIVGVLSDEAVARRKRLPIMNLEERMRVVAACRYVDEVRAHQERTSNDFMQRHDLSIKVYAAVDEEENTERVERYRRQGLDPRYYRRIPYTPTISTTRIIQRLRDREA